MIEGDHRDTGADGHVDVPYRDAHDGTMSTMPTTRQIIVTIVSSCPSCVIRLQPPPTGFIL